MTRTTGGRRGEGRRAEIVRSALEVIAERGYRGATLSAVAERVGLTQQGLLHYFPTKEALLVAVLAERDQWDTGSARRGQGEPWPLDLLSALVEYNAMRPGIVQTFSALLGESVTDHHPAGEFFRRRYDRVRADMADTLRGEFGDRLPSGLTPEAVAPLLVAVLDGLQFQWLHDPERVDMPAVFRSFVALLGGPVEERADRAGAEHAAGPARPGYATGPARPERHGTPGAAGAAGL
ncbi:TetR/AcrR family transcriptional regulator [Streptomyces palmae]|uniref:TetR family transcriptional regulator n=1 Tax=Streptomyces palmae TaxID=1701085 RepID=A0A4Z0H5U6_9ACTN|nr:TetR/AcrR family transcriptional regulator [Streptomyces palmae]TGB07228.1 TetR family transcriptional regulator [Streptomyces palmae]